MDANWMYVEKAWRQFHKNDVRNIEQFLAATPHKLATVQPPTAKKMSKLDEPDIQDTAEEVGTSSLGMYSSGPLHMGEQSRATSKNLYTTVLWRRPARSDGR